VHEAANPAARIFLGALLLEAAEKSHHVMHFQ
jgi:hypothetical protein